MTNVSISPADRVRPLLRVRQIREFTAEALTADEIGAIADAARWSGSSSNSQPWRFIVLPDREAIRRVGELSLPQTRAALTAAAGIAIVVPDDPRRAISHAYDEGRAAERMLVAASLLDLGAGISWVMPDRRDAVARALSLPEGWTVRTLVSLGHPTEAALAPKSERGKGRLPRYQVVFEGSWPADL